MGQAGSSAACCAAGCHWANKERGWCLPPCSRICYPLVIPTRSPGPPAPIALLSDLPRSDTSVGLSWRGMEAALLLLWVLQRHLLLIAIGVTSHTAWLCICRSAVLHFCYLAASCISIYRLKERRAGKERGNFHSFHSMVLLTGPKWKAEVDRHGVALQTRGRISSKTWL